MALGNTFFFFSADDLVALKKKQTKWKLDHFSYLLPFCNSCQRIHRPIDDSNTQKVGPFPDNAHSSGLVSARLPYWEPDGLSLQSYQFKPQFCLLLLSWSHLTPWQVNWPLRAFVSVGAKWINLSSFHQIIVKIKWKSGLQPSVGTRFSLLSRGTTLSFILQSCGVLTGKGTCFFAARAERASPGGGPRACGRPVDSLLSNLEIELSLSLFGAHHGFGNLFSMPLHEATTMTEN